MANFGDFTSGGQGINFGSNIGGGGLGSLSGDIGGGLGAAGLGLSIAGTLSGMSEAKQQSQLSMGVAQGQENIDALRQQQMQLQSSRQSMENLRNTQKALATGKAAAANQGALYGSGYAGGQAQATDQGGWNALNINQNLEIGNQIFAQDQTIDQEKIQEAQVAGKQATSQGEMAIGGDVLSAGLKILSL